MMTRESPRVRRLRTDYLAIQKLASESSVFQFEVAASGMEPPHEYLLRFRGTGLFRSATSLDVGTRPFHEVFVRLGANYPRMMPELNWRTPIFHPNISTSGVVCLGGYGTYWVPSLHLDELCVMLWDMIRYANYDVKSPYNREAAHWAKTQSHLQLPLDPRPLRDRVGQSGSCRSPTATRSAVYSPPDIQFLGDVVEVEVVDAEVVESGPEEILIIE